MITKADLATIQAVIAPAFRGYLDQRLAPIEAALSIRREGFTADADAEEAVLSELRRDLASLDGELFDGCLSPSLTTHSHNGNLAEYSPSTNSISVHSIVLGLADRAYIRGLLLHELCHAATGDRDGAEPHGNTWACNMRRCGLEPLPSEIRVVKHGPFEGWLNRQQSV